MKNDVNVVKKDEEQKLEKKNIFVYILKVTDPEPDPDSLVKGTYPRICIRIRIRTGTKMSRNRNTAKRNTVTHSWVPSRVPSGWRAWSM